MLEDFIQWFPGTNEILANMTEQYQWKDRIPKYKLFVRLDPNISDDDRLFVSNGIRAFFESQLTRLFERKEIKDNVQQVNNVFNIMVYIIGAISLTIAFFLLLISTT
jgi:hypothetical protein